MRRQRGADGTHLWIPPLAILAVLTFGIVGYQVVEGFSLLDAVYMTVITLSTVGFREVRDLSSRGEVFTICLILAGMAVVATSLTVATRALVEGEMQRILGRRKLEKRIAALSDHYVVCGYGRMGKIVSRELARQGLAVVAVDPLEDAIQVAEDAGELFVRGDATQEDTLARAGVPKAKGLVATLPTDADNVFVTLTAREMKADLYIVARAETEATERKLLRAGANRVFSPYEIGGQRIALAILRPTVLDFVEIATSLQSLDLQMEEIAVENDVYRGVSLKDSGIKKQLNVIVVAIQKKTGQMVFNPIPDAQLEVGDKLVVLGEPGNVGQLRAVFSKKP